MILISFLYSAHIPADGITSKPRRTLRNTGKELAPYPMPGRFITGRVKHQTSAGPAAKTGWETLTRLVGQALSGAGDCSAGDVPRVPGPCQLLHRRFCALFDCPPGRDDIWFLGSDYNIVRGFHLLELLLCCPDLQLSESTTLRTGWR